MEEFKPTLAKLVGLYDGGKLKCNIDFGQALPSGAFKGLDSIVSAVEVRGQIYYVSFGNTGIL